MKWPTAMRWQRWAKGKYPNLMAQSVQQIINEFSEAVQATTMARKAGLTSKYPWRKSKYRDVIYTNQSATIKNGVLRLPNGKAGRLSIKIPDGVTFSGRIMEATLIFGKVRVVCEVPDLQHPSGPVIGVDLGINTLIAATDGEKAVLIPGRGVKSTVQWRNKRLASLQAKQSTKVKYSKRWKRLQKRKYKLLDKAASRVKDAVHKATRQVADAFPNAKAKKISMTNNDKCFIKSPYSGSSE